MLTGRSEALGQSRSEAKQHAAAAELAKEKAARALANLADNDDNEAAIVAAGGIEVFMSLARDGNEAQKERAAAALANVGPGLNEIIGPANNYFEITTFSKFFLCIGMLVGRLELFPILILLSPQLWKR